MSAVAVMSPPITPMARGRCTSEPGPVAKSSGIKPNAVIEAVISTGRRRRFAPRFDLTCQCVQPAEPGSENLHREIASHADDHF